MRGWIGARVGILCGDKLAGTMRHHETETVRVRYGMNGNVDVVYFAEDTVSGQYVKIRVPGSHARGTGQAGFTLLFAVNQKKRRKCRFPSKGWGESRVANVPPSSAFWRTHGLGRAISMGWRSSQCAAVVKHHGASVEPSQSECVILRTGGQSSCCAAIGHYMPWLRTN